MKGILLLASIFVFRAWGFNDDFKTTSNKIPLEFNLLFDSLKMKIESPAEKIRMVGLCQDLDNNLNSLGKEHMFLLMKSEVIKNVLEHKFTKVRKFDVTTTLIERLNHQFQQKEKSLTPFSKWIWRSFLAELNYRKEMGLITNQTFNPNIFSNEKKQEAYRLQRYLKYLIPWIDQMDKLTANQFNLLAKEVSWDILEKLNARSILFKRHAGTLTEEARIRLFNIPQKLREIHPEEIKRIKQTEDLSLKEQSEKARSEAKDTIEKITPDDMSPLSDDVIEKIQEKSE